LIATETLAGDRALGARIALGGLVISSAALALLASAPESPVSQVLLEGAEPIPPLEDAARVLRIDRLSPRLILSLPIAFLVLGALSFLELARATWRGLLSLRSVVVFAVGLHVFFLFVPNLFSQDVYNYTMYGRIVVEHGGNPYVDEPEDFPDDALLPLIGYQETPSVYGPVFTALSAGVVLATPDDASAIWFFKFISVAASLAAMWLVIAAAKSVVPTKVAFAAAMVGLNPAVLFHTVGGAHNDTLAGACIAAAALFVVRRKTMWAVALLTLGTLIKSVVVLPLVLLIAYVVCSSERGRRLRATLQHLGLAAAVGLPFVIPFFDLSNPTAGALPGAGRFAQESGAIEMVLGGLGLDAAAEPLAKLAQFLALIVTLAATAAIIYWFFRTPRVPAPVVLVAAWGWVLLLAILSIDQHWPWYVAWVLPCAWALAPTGRIGVILTSFALTILHPFLNVDPGSDVALISFYFALAMIGVLLVWMTLSLFRSLIKGTIANDEIPEPALHAGQPV
jgi:hypothetical protein